MTIPRGVAKRQRSSANRLNRFLKAFYHEELYLTVFIHPYSTHTIPYPCTVYSCLYRIPTVSTVIPNHSPDLILMSASVEDEERPLLDCGRLHEFVVLIRLPEHFSSRRLHFLVLVFDGRRVQATGFGRHHVLSNAHLKGRKFNSVNISFLD